MRGLTRRLIAATALLALVPAAQAQDAAKPVSTKPADSKPADSKPAATKPAATKPASTKAAAQKAKAAKPAQTKPAQANSKSPQAKPLAAPASGLPLPRPAQGAGSAILATPGIAIPPADLSSSRPAQTAPAAAPAKPLAMAPASPVSRADLDNVARGLELIRKGRGSAASELIGQTRDPVARKLIEWAALRAETGDFDFNRYAAFIAANPDWPNVVQFRRKAEAALWQNPSSDAQVRGFFAAQKPVSAKGKLILARAALTQGDRGLAQQLVRDAWRNDSFSGEMERRALDSFGALLSAADHKARMDRLLYAEDIDEGMRTAERLGGAQLAIAKARAGVVRKAGNTKSLLDAVPAAAQSDPLYIFSMAQWLRRQDRIADAAKWMLKAPNAAHAIVSPDEWWTERRILARKLLDEGDAKTAFRVAAGAAMPEKEHPQVEQLFTSGWIALRFLGDPATAMPYFAKIAEIAEHPASLSRSYYWQGRAAEAKGAREEARHFYERGARYSTAYYGQLARAKLGAGEFRLPPAPAHHPQAGKLEIVRAIEILYAIDERDLVASAIADLADKSTDASVLAAIAGVVEKNNDPRGLVLLGRVAIGRGFPFEAYAYPVAGLPRYNPVGAQVEPHIAYAIARQESGFNPRAVSSANALGLMQVTPATGKDIAKRSGIAFDAKRLLNDPVYNVQMGAAELGDVIDTYRGSYILSFVAYNAGRRRVREWIERYGDPRDPKVDPVDWVELIPFSETRNYVQRVLENMQVYRVRFGGAPKLLIEADLRRGTAN